MSPEPFVSRAKAPPAKRSEKGYGDENGTLRVGLGTRLSETTLLSGLVNIEFKKFYDVIPMVYFKANHTNVGREV